MEERCLSINKEVSAQAQVDGKKSKSRRCYKSARRIVQRRKKIDSSLKSNHLRRLEKKITTRL